MLKSKTIYILMGLILISSVTIASAGRLDFPKNDRLCEHGWLAPQLPIWFCSIQGIEPYTMEASFFDHPTMQDYYRGYREQVVTGDVTTTMTVRPIKNSKSQEIVIREYIDLNVEPDYLYVKGN